MGIALEDETLAGVDIADQIGAGSERRLERRILESLRVDGVLCQLEVRQGTMTGTTDVSSVLSLFLATLAVTSGSKSNLLQRRVMPCSTSRLKTL